MLEKLVILVPSCCRHKKIRPPNWGPKGPDIVFCAHGSNDYIQDGDQREAHLMKDTTQVSMEDLLQTANAVRPCYTATVLLDDLASSHGVDDVLEQPHTITALVAQLAGWYQTGAISYANAVCHLVTGHATTVIALSHKTH